MYIYIGGAGARLRRALGAGRRAALAPGRGLMYF